MTRRRRPATTTPDTEHSPPPCPGSAMPKRWSAEQRFHHWELVFPEVMGPAIKGGGFDLVVGNPPWVKVSWSEMAIAY